ncbi:hypothetical protein OO013_10780 [Mangrovivirga sp. M17]|uniref:Lipoprotein SmpA/OmlA domain-containing protein n=1 Tax=Mangrovivirga halotolerans TaxID=2993936 RepID=A0ABT3RSM2_9BACT|nr:hypothetical protein [Mangrovivirga halotolerans]MCX2744354.1 hypothetical protein [Mangrovivirga halotolerans]
MKSLHSVNLLSSKLFILVGLISLFISACGSDIDLPNFNEETWINDIKGCSGERLEMIDELELNKGMLIGLTTHELKKALGSPDNIVLYTRNQKYYHYYLNAGSQCPDVSEDAEEGQKLIIKMSALDKVSNIEFPVN